MPETRRSAARLQRHPPCLGRCDRALDPERYRPLALDLPGHGEAADARGPITFAGCVEQVLARGPERFALCGYSLGGRVALHVALAAPERVSRLVLIVRQPGHRGSPPSGPRAGAPTARSPRSSKRIPFEELHRALAHPAAVRR